MSDLDIVDSIVGKLVGSLSPIEWIKNNLGKVMQENQIPIIEAIFNPNINKTLVLEARQSGKTEGFACGILADIQLSSTSQQWIIYGPKEGQAFIIFNRIVKMHQKNQDKMRKKIVDIKRRDELGTGLIEFDDGSTVRAASAAVGSQSEGASASKIAVDEKINGGACISTPSGDRILRDIIKDKNLTYVWSYNHATKSVEAKLVTAKHSPATAGKRVFKLRVKDDAGNEHEIIASENHPIYSDGEYINASDIRCGSRIKIIV